MEFDRKVLEDVVLPLTDAERIALAADLVEAYVNLTKYRDDAAESRAIQREELKRRETEVGEIVKILRQGERPKPAEVGEVYDAKAGVVHRFLIVEGAALQQLPDRVMREEERQKPLGDLLTFGEIEIPREKPRLTLVEEPETPAPVGAEPEREGGPDGVNPEPEVWDFDAPAPDPEPVPAPEPELMTPIALGTKPKRKRKPRGAVLPREALGGVEPAALGYNFPKLTDAFPGMKGALEELKAQTAEPEPAPVVKGEPLMVPPEVRPGFSDALAAITARTEAAARRLVPKDELQGLVPAPGRPGDVFGPAPPSPPTREDSTPPEGAQHAEGKKKSLLAKAADLLRG